MKGLMIDLAKVKSFAFKQHISTMLGCITTAPSIIAIFLKPKS